MVHGICRQNEKRGFSIIELIVAIGVSVLLTTIALAWSSQSRNYVSLNVERTKIAQVMQRAKSLAIATYAQNPGACGYGVVFIADNYHIIRYVDPTCVNGLGAGGTDETLESFSISPGVQIDTSGANRLMRVVFIPPEPKAYVYNSAGIVMPEGFIYLSTKDGAATSSIHVGAGGAIEF